MRASTVLSRFRNLFTARTLVIGVPMVWLFALAALPLLIVLDISLAHMNITSVSSLWQWSDDELTLKFNFGNYLYLGDDSLYFNTYLSSVKYAAMTTLYCLALGYPFAYFIARAPSHLRPMLLMLVMLPFWTSFLLRIYAWKALLADNGVVNTTLMNLGWLATPIHMMHTSFSLTIGMVYAYLPFMVLPLYATLVKLDERLLEASADLGASPLKTFWLVTVPLSKRGIIAGSLLVFIPAFGEYVIPELLGGARTLMIARVLWDEFFSNNDWPMASAVTIVMILLIIVPMALFNRYNDETKVGEKS
ncbi:putrescine ABC transporter permease PotH [Halothiobacillus diazotrophicus]|uniref:Putrescine ABC transporter permease PotH n=1 Tax=Halothiobacillus diazotrophicus TaxID=1860122 RepID=A0A191ZHX0_9GAMM|nr:ABC transporter permease subunit [Halothiobacillus diazotrophicus]ANJ67491.1 putrescine ABC transporter permease PotH [Halothiobacillus diazotrophicus]